MNHLETLIKQYYEWRGYIVRTNVKVGKLTHGGWAGELDVVAYHPTSGYLIHLEPSIDAHSWAKREERFSKKFAAGRRHICTDVFPWLRKNTHIRQVAILISASRKELAGAEVRSIDEFVREIRDRVKEEGHAAKSAIPEQYDLLRTIQLVESGYYRRLGAAETEYLK